MHVEALRGQARGLAVGAPDGEISRYPGATSLTTLSAGMTTWYVDPLHGRATP